MRWNWQHEKWPEFTWSRARLARAEERFLFLTGEFLGAARHLNADDTEQLTVESMSTEAVTTSEIEGEILDRASVQSSIRRRLGLAADHRSAKPGEQGIAEMTVDLHQSFAAPLTETTLFEWHQMLMRDRRDLKNVGRYRRHDDPMQVVSGPIHAPKVHFEAPPSARASDEMEKCIAWFNRTAPGGAPRCLLSRGPGLPTCILNPSILSKMAMAASGARWSKKRSHKILVGQR